MIIYIRAISRFLRHLFETLLTSFGWIGFGFIFAAGIVSILRGEMSGPEAPFLPAQFVSSIGTVVGYGILMLLGAVLLISWAKYNQHRFAGVDRRKAPDPLSKMQLCKSFAISNDQFDAIYGRRMLVVHHDDNANIRAVDVIDKDTLLAYVVRDRQRQAAQEIRKQEIRKNVGQQPKQNIKRGGWSFVDLWPAVRYESHDSWVAQCDFYGLSRKTA